MITEITASGAATIIGTGAAVVTSIFAGIAVMVKTWLIPYVRDSIEAPLKETHHQVTVNHHSSDAPTLLDLLDNVRSEAIGATNRVREDVGEVRGDVKELGGKVDGVVDTQERVGEELKQHLKESAAERLLRTREQLALWTAMDSIAKAEPPQDEHRGGKHTRDEAE